MHIITHVCLIAVEEMVKRQKTQSECFNGNLPAAIGQEVV